MSGCKEVLVVDDHPLARLGFKGFIGRSKTFRVTSEAATYKEGLAMALEHKPDIALVVISLPDGNGIDLAREIRTALPQTIVVTVNFDKDKADIVDSFQAGASGHLTKDASCETILEALEVVSQGDYFFERAISRESFEELKDFARKQPTR
jgi:DNA-binding NarL/FixJ family response regulator